MGYCACDISVILTGPHSIQSALYCPVCPLWDEKWDLTADLAQKWSDLIHRIWWKLKFETSSLRMCIACLLTFDLRGNDMLNVDFGFFKGLSVQPITQLDIVSSWYGDSFGWESQAQNDIFFMWIWLISYCDYFLVVSIWLKYPIFTVFDSG